MLGSTNFILIPRCFHRIRYLEMVYDILPNDFHSGLVADADYVGFYINLPLGVLVAIFMALIDIPDITKKEPVSMDLIRRVIPQLDPFGFAMFVPSAIMFLLALQFGSGQAYAWNSPVIIGLFCGAGGLAILFILWEARIGDRAMLPGSVLRPRIVWVSCIVLISFAFCLFAASSFMPLYFQAVKGLSPNISGIYTLPSIISQLIFIIIVGVTSKS